MKLTPHEEKILALIKKNPEIITDTKKRTVIAEENGLTEKTLWNRIGDLKKYGVTTLSEIAKALNARGIPTVRNGEWYPSTVRNYVNRCSSNVYG